MTRSPLLLAARRTLWENFDARRGAKKHADRGVCGGVELLDEEAQTARAHLLTDELPKWKRADRSSVTNVAKPEQAA